MATQGFNVNKEDLKAEFHRYVTAHQLIRLTSHKEFEIIQSDDLSIFYAYTYDEESLLGINIYSWNYEKFKGFAVKVMPKFFAKAEELGYKFGEYNLTILEDTEASHLVMVLLPTDKSKQITTRFMSLN